ncbi:MAG: M81 family metallopeptidase [Gemmataceae bacterium]|nr:M81 family metallopeptidase [Gemmataceae bacterium]
MRVAVAGCLHESNTFVGSWTDRRCFVEGYLGWGEALIPVWGPAHHEVGGFLAALAREGVDTIPIGMAWATPGGPVTDAFFDEVCDRFCTELRRCRPDGILLALHGAMVTPRFHSADTELLSRVRSAVGDDIPVAVTLDFHANVTAEMADLADIIVAYQTYPHVDQWQCGYKAAQLLISALRQKRRPVTVVAKPPLFIPILAQETQQPPMSELLEQARQLEQRPGVLAVSLVAGFPYADVPAMGASVVVVAQGDQRPAAAEAAEELAASLWSRRHQLQVPAYTIPEAVQRGCTAPSTPVLLIDLGDNIGGGTAGDGTRLLEELLRQKVQGFLAVLWAPEAVAMARQRGVGASLTVTVGGTDPRQGSPLTLHGIVRALHDGRWIEPDPRHGGRRFHDQGPTAVLELDDDNLLVLNSLRTPPFSLGQLTSLGLEPARRRMIIVKAAIAYKAAYTSIAGTILPVDTPGPTAAQPHLWPEHFPYARISRPLFPLDAEALW